MRNGLETGGSGGLTRLIELSNGCICCGVKDDLVNALEELVRLQPPDQPLDHIIIESSGLAQVIVALHLPSFPVNTLSPHISHPTPPARPSRRLILARRGSRGAPCFSKKIRPEKLREPYEQATVCLDGIVTVVDAYHLPKNLSLGGAWDGGFASAPTARPGALGELTAAPSDATCAAQIAYADRIVVNKCDLVSGDAVPALLAMVAGINALAEVRCTSHADVPLEFVLEAKAYEVAAPLRAAAGLKPWQAALSSAIEGSEADGSGDRNGDEGKAQALAAALASGATHRHPVGVGSIAVVLDNCVVDEDLLDKWLSALLWTQPTPSDLGPSATSKTGAESPPAAPSDPIGAPFDFMAMEVFRMKGVLAVARRGEGGYPVVSPLKHVLQVVHGLFEVTETVEAWEVLPGAGQSPWESSQTTTEGALDAEIGTPVGAAGSIDSASLEGQSSPDARKYGHGGVRLVVIGKNLNRRRIESGIRSCVIEMP